MKPAEQWLSQYAETHQSSLNKRIHLICVPLILWSVTALLWAIPSSDTWGDRPLLNWSTLALMLSMIFYVQLGFRYFLEMLAVAVVVSLANYGMAQAGWPLGWIASAVFVLAWIGQFYGHKVEGKKPSFFEDLFFLLIGPLWIIEHFIRREPSAKPPS